MTAPPVDLPGSPGARLRWLLSNLVKEVPGVQSVAVVSSDGLLLLSSDPDTRPAGARRSGAGHLAYGRGGHQEPVSPEGAGADLATLVSGLGALTGAAAKLLDGGPVKQTMVAMDEGSLFVMAISDGSLLAVHALPECDISVVAYHMAMFVGRAGHVLTPELRTQLRTSMEQELDR